MKSSLKNKSALKSPKSGLVPSSSRSLTNLMPQSPTARGSLQSRNEAVATHQKLSNDLEQAKSKLANIAGILMELSESYYDLMGGFCWCCNLSKLDIVVQECLAAYERRVGGHLDEGKDVNEWTNLIGCQIEGRCRRNTVLGKQTSRRQSSYKDKTNCNGPGGNDSLSLSEMKRSNKLVRSLVDAISIHTWYPTAEQLAQVFQVLLTRYPFLRDNSPSGYKLLKASVQAKFAKTRKPLVSVQEIARMQAKFGTTVHVRNRKRESDLTVESPILKKSRPLFDLSLVSLCNGEDETSLAMHEAWLSNEVHRLKPNWEEIRDRLARTCLQRKAVLSSCSTAEALERFPYLKVPDVMLHECHLRFGKKLQWEMEKNFQDYITNLLQHKRQNGFMPVLTTSIHDCLEEEQKKDFETCAAILQLPVVNGESMKFFCLLNEEPSSNYPVISLRQLNEKNPLKVANITIRADGKEVVSDIVGLPQAVCCLIGTYYLLDISFPPNLKKTLSFIQCCICNLEPMEKAPIAVSRLQNELVRKK